VLMQRISGAVRAFKAQSTEYKGKSVQPSTSDVELYTPKRVR
jgi:hypothetical protein